MVKKLPKEEDFEEEEDDDDEEEDDEWDDDKESDVDESETVSKPVKQETRGRPRKDEQSTSSEFIAFHQAERNGIMDAKTRQPIFEDMWSALAEIFNRLQKIEDALTK